MIVVWLSQLSDCHSNGSTHHSLYLSSRTGRTEIEDLREDEMDIRQPKYFRIS